MPQEENKKLTDSFKAAVQTEQLLKGTNDLIQLLKKSLQNVQSSIVEMTILSDLRVLDVCLATIQNQQRQDKKMAELEKRLADLEDGGPVIKLDKGPKQ